MTGVELIATERARQVAEEGWTAEHDGGHDREELALAAVCYAAPGNAYVGTMNNRRVEVEDAWPWNAEEFKGDPGTRAWGFKQGGQHSPHSIVITNRPHLRAARIRELVKAGALVAAEIDRLLRVPEEAPR